MSDLYFGDAENREIDSISNERIAKGEIVLETYEVLHHLILYMLNCMTSKTDMSHLTHSNSDLR